MPDLIRVVSIHGLELLQRIFAKILFVNLTIWSDDERLYSSNPVFSRCCRKGKTADHCAANDKVHLTHWRSWSLAFQHLEIVTVVGSVWFGRVTFLQCPCYFRPDRPAPGAIRIL